MDERKANQGFRSPGTMGKKPLIGLTMFVLGTLVFAILAYNLVTHGLLIRWDLPLAQFFHTTALNSSRLVIDIMLFGYYIGYDGVIVFGVLLGLYFLYKRFWKELAMAAASIGLAGLLFLLLSHIFKRPRPFTLFDKLIFPGSPNTPGFPSGHALIIVVLFGFLIYLSWPKIKSRLGRVSMVLIALLLALFIGFSRLYIGDHYLTDVIAGYAVGIAWFGLTCTVVELLFKGYIKRKALVIPVNEKNKTFSPNPVLSTLIRIGYGARGLIYGIIGFLAIEFALGVSGSLQDQQGAIASLGHQLFGQILLVIILIGLVCYSLWGLIRAFFNPLHKGKLERIGFFISALAYGILILPTYNFISGAANAAQNGAQVVQLRNIVSTIFLLPLGKWIVGFIGAIVLGVGIYQLYRGVRWNFDKQVKSYTLTSRQIKIIKIFGRFGTLARAIVFSLVGIFLLFAAYYSNVGEVKGIDGALLVILQQPYGHWLLGITALGLIAFGSYSLLSAFLLKFKKSEITSNTKKF